MNKNVLKFPISNIIVNTLDRRAIHDQFESMLAMVIDAKRILNNSAGNEGHHIKSSINFDRRGDALRGIEYVELRIKTLLCLLEMDAEKSILSTSIDDIIKAAEDAQDVLDGVMTAVRSKDQ